MHLVRLLRFVMLVALLFTCTAVSAEELLRRSPGSWLYGPVALWTVGSTSTVTFFPLSEPMRSSDVNAARFAWQMTQDSGDCKLRGAVRFSNDGVNWEAAKSVDAQYSDANDEVVWKTAFIDLTSVTDAPPRTFIQFGLQTVNRSGSAIALCNGTLRVEPKEN